MANYMDNSSNHIIIDTQEYVYEGASLPGFDKVLNSNSNPKLIGIELNENIYAQLNSSNSDDMTAETSLNSSDSKIELNNSANKNDSANLTNSPLGLAKESEYSSITSTNSDSKIILGESFSWGGYFQAIGVLFLLLGLLCVVLWLMRKYGKFSFLPNASELPKNALRLEAQLPLGPRKSLNVVRYLDKRLLLGVTDQQITLLSESKVNSDTNDTDDTNDTEFKELFAAEQEQNKGK